MIVLWNKAKNHHILLTRDKPKMKGYGKSGHKKKDVMQTLKYTKLSLVGFPLKLT